MILKHLSQFVGLLIVTLAIFFIITGLPSTQITETTSGAPISLVDETNSTTSPKIDTLRSFRILDLEAKAIHVYDVRNNKNIFALQENIPLPLASITKLMTALVALEYAPSKDAVITIGYDALQQKGDNGFFFQEQWNLASLLDVMLVGSSNDSAQAIALSIGPFITSTETEIKKNPEALFIDAMNDRAKRLGLVTTTFSTPTGLDIHNETEASAYGSAKDMTSLFSYILKHHPSILEPTQQKQIIRSSLTHGSHYVENTNELADEISLLIGAKTGFTDHAGGNLIVGFDVGPAHPIVITVLGSTAEGRFDDMKQLISATKDYFSYDN